MIELDHRGDLAGKLVAGIIIQVVLVLFGVGPAAGELGKAPRPRGRRQPFQVGQQVPEPPLPAA